MSIIHMFLSLLLSVKMSMMFSLCHHGNFSQPSYAFISVAMSSPAAKEYTVDIEISFENASFLESVKTYLNSLSFPIQVNDSDQATNILSMVVTTGE